jgi:hypothetical protein
MPADVVLSNLNPNQKWYAKISDAGASGLVELFNTEADAEAGANRVAYASFEFGTAVEVILINNTEDPEIDYFNSYSAWHLKVTFADGDSTAIIPFGPDTILPEIIDPLLVTDQSCEDRAKREIDGHTKIKISRTLTLGTHIQGLEVGDKRKLTDNIRGLDQQVRVDDIVIQGNEKSLIDIVTVTEFEDATR